MLLITIVNLRGVKEAGGVFMIPTYLFVGTLLITILIGVFRALAGAWTSHARGRSSRHPGGQRDGRRLAVAKSVRQRLHRAHRR